MTSVSIRRAATADEPFLFEMLYEALYVPPGSPPFPRAVLESPHIAPYVAGFGTQAGDIGFIAVFGIEDVGAAWARFPTPDHRGYGYVDDETPELSMAVVAGHRNAGIGSALLDHLVDACPRLSLSVDMRNPAVRVYERAGFRSVADDGNSLTMLRNG